MKFIALVIQGVALIIMGALKGITWVVKWVIKGFQLLGDVVGWIWGQFEKVGDAIESVGNMLVGVKKKFTDFFEAIGQGAIDAVSWMFGSGFLHIPEGTKEANASLAGTTAGFKALNKEIALTARTSNGLKISGINMAASKNYGNYSVTGVGNYTNTEPLETREEPRRNGYVIPTRSVVPTETAPALATASVPQRALQTTATQGSQAPQGTVSMPITIVLDGRVLAKVLKEMSAEELFRNFGYASGPMRGLGV